MKTTYGPEYVVQAAKLLFSGMSYSATAREMDVDRTTLWRWSKKKLFQKTYEDELERCLKRMEKRLQAMDDEFDAQLDSPDTKEAQRAALEILRPFK